MEFKINGQPFVVAGVIEREQDFASKAAYTAGMGIYMSYEGYSALVSENAGLETASAGGGSVGINCYEVVMANPVKNFALNFAREKFPIGGGLLVDNTGRYDYETILKLTKSFGQRSMQTHGVILPYWENAARSIEDWCLVLLLCAMVTAVLPLVLLVIWAVRLFILGKTKLEENLLPKARDNVAEAIRVRQRRAWEKRHLKKK